MRPLPCPCGARGAAGVRIRRCLPLWGKGAAKQRAGSWRIAKKTGFRSVLPVRELSRRVGERSCGARLIAFAFRGEYSGRGTWSRPAFHARKKPAFRPSRHNHLPPLAIPRGDRRALPAPAQGSRVDCQASATVSKKTSKGVRQPIRLRGLRLIRSRTRSNSACDTSRKLQPRGKKYRSSPLAETVPNFV